MAKTWTVVTNDGAPLATIESHPDRRISIVIHITGFITTGKAEEVRLALGAAIGNAQAQGTDGL